MVIITPEESLEHRRRGWKLIVNVVILVSEANEELSGQKAA
jgi:hypothetical protein